MSLSDKERFFLVGAPYHPPSTFIGDEIEDVARGEYCKVGGWTDAPISWPRRMKTGSPSLICTDELARAIRTESALALRHWFGIGPVVVWKLRKLLGVERADPSGTRRLYELYGRIKLTPEIGAKGRGKISQPEIRAKISRMKTGKKLGPMPPERRQKIREAKLKYWAKRSRSSISPH